ncbi:hypothetical protein [Cupriavidus oxalaticus]|uniref:hypothetical protein n=1 Tax=Cupriavidus oxalaticus TaxID=96344 RepID=UPI00124725EE|nr:hypothetical protein [Cupriavidus oxalaticus]
MWSIDSVRKYFGPERRRAEEVAKIQEKIEQEGQYRDALLRQVQVCRIELAKMATSFDLDVALKIKAGITPNAAYKLTLNEVEAKKISCEIVTQTAKDSIKSIDELGDSLRALTGN